MENTNTASSSSSRNVNRPTMTVGNVPSNSASKVPLRVGSEAGNDNRRVVIHGRPWFPPHMQQYHYSGSWRQIPINQYHAPPPLGYYVPAPPPTELNLKIRKQIEFYFSDDNLAKDVYLRSNMDNEGWVLVTVIASFRRICALTDDIEVILDSLEYSDAVQVERGKLRKRNNWKKWLLPPEITRS